jgi:rRNA maturation RNase YbeY
MSEANPKQRRAPGEKYGAVTSQPTDDPSRTARFILQIRNRQRRQPVDVRLLRQILASALTDELGVAHYEVGIHLVGASEMTHVNETFLRHAGSTDVITFSHRESPSPTELHGEVFVCVDEAVELAPRFRGTWQSEVVRYAVHAFLHLQGHDDLEPAARRRMKRVENRVMTALRNRFAVGRISPKLRRAG